MGGAHDVHVFEAGAGVLEEGVERFDLAVDAVVDDEVLGEGGEADQAEGEGEEELGSPAGHGVVL